MSMLEREPRPAGPLTVGMDTSMAPPRPHRFLLVGAVKGDSALRRMLAVGDAAAVLVALGAAVSLSGGLKRADYLVWWLVAIPLTIVLFKVYGLYDRDVKRISHSTVDDLPWLAHAIIIETLLLWLYSKPAPMSQLDFAQVVLFGLLALVLTTSARWAIRSFAARRLGQEAALLIGGGKVAQTVSAKLAAHPEYRCKVIGVLADDEFEPSSVPPMPLLGTPDDLERIAQEHGVQRVIVSLGQRDDEHQLEELLRQCRKLSLKLSLLPKLSDMLGPAVEIDDVEGMTVLGVNPPWLPRSSRALKRAMDIAFAGALLLLFAPLIAAIALAIKLESGGPVFFAQTRVGRDGRRFNLFKFRTMAADAEERRAELLEQSTDPKWLKLDHDPRITPLGRRLRRLSLDELPQLWNVLRGQMSMVGPRPLIEAEDEWVEGWARGRLNLTPGITGYWQVLGRNRIPFDEMVKLDYLYVMNWSLWEDIRLMLRTLPAVITGRGAQ